MCRAGGRRCPSSTTNRPSRSKAAAAVRSMAPDIAAEFHEDWRADFLHDNGKRAKRVKTTTDAAWIANNGTDQVDIAHTPFSELPDDWKAENLAAAKVATGFVANHLPELGTPRKRAKVIADGAAHIHEQWLKRNTWAKGGELDVPFKKLPHKEQLKDMVQIDTVLAQLEPTRDVGYEMYASTDDVNKAKGLFAASLAGSGKLTSREMVGARGVSVKRRRAGTFEDGTPRWKYTGTATVHRDPLPKGRDTAPTRKPTPSPEKARASKKEAPTPSPKVDYTDRDTVIKTVRGALKARSGKAWSVRGGTGTAHGWITITAPPKRQVNGFLSDEDAKELHALLGISYRPAKGVRTQHITVPANSAYRQEFVDRAQGRTPSVEGEPYWD